MTVPDLRRLVAAVFQAARNVAPPAEEAETEQAAVARSVILGWLEASEVQIASGLADGLLVAAAAHAQIPVELD